jgi:hypothetical protein
MQDRRLSDSASYEASQTCCELSADGASLRCTYMNDHHPSQNLAVDGLARGSCIPIDITLQDSLKLSLLIGASHVPSI